MNEAMVGLEPIEGASKYALAETGYIYNMKTARRLKRQWVGSQWKTLIETDDKRKVWLPHNTLEVPLATVHLPDDTYQQVKGFPDYDCTPYGAVWRTRNLRTRCGSKPMLLQEFFRGEQRYVRLRDGDGKVHNVPVDKIVKDCYPED